MVIGGTRAQFLPGSRLPALRRVRRSVGGHFALFELISISSNPAFAAGDWDLWGEATGLEPSTVYTVVLARMALQVNGELDQHQVLTGNPVSDPDELSFLPGEEMVYAGVTCDYSAITRVSADMNPVALGVIETDAGGNGTVDCIIRATPGDLWPVPAEGAEVSTAEDFTAENTPFGSNATGANVAAGQFNYLLLYEGAPTGDAIRPGAPPCACSWDPTSTPPATSSTTPWRRSRPALFPTRPNCPAA